ncbi:MAG: tetratricopeptide repeat protein [Bradymonadales bacterium]|nr:tetratricopeptide repeat protein [Bradymonadales bacterium]
MMCSSEIRCWGLKGSVLILALLPAFRAGAQPESGQESPAVSGELAEPPEGMPARDCSEEALAEMAADDIRTTPVRSDVLASGLTVEEAEALRRQIYDVRMQQITQLRTMLQDMPADYPRRADLLFRLAEAYWEVADADYMAVRATYNACIDDWMHCRRNEICVEPIPDYSAAIDQYREILRDRPDYERIDEVIFRLGDGLIKDEQSAEGIQYLTRLTNTYPESRYIPEARFLMGEHYFDRDLLIAARQNYEAVLNYLQSPYYNFSIYKLAWIDLNETQYRDSVERFQTVIRNIDQAEASGQEVRFDLRADALNDMLRSYAEIDNGWIEARQYLLEHEGEDVMRRKLLAMADLYDQQGKDEERVAVMDWFMERYPTDERVPTWAEFVGDSMLKIGNWDRYEARVRELVRLLDPNGSWAIANGQNQLALNQARQYSEAAFLGIISRNYQEAQRLARQDLYQKVAEDYDEFFRRWPDSTEAYAQRFYYAEVLYYNIGDHERAGEQYLEVVRMDTEGEHAHDAIIGALQAYDDLMKTEVPDIDEEREILSREQLEAMRREGFEQGELGPRSQRYVEVVEYFAELFPDDDQIPVASWRAAELYRRVNRIADAARRFETIIQHHPNHRFAEEAAISAFLCYQFVEDWERIEVWARFLLEHNPNPENTDINPERLQRAIAYAINEQAQDLLEANQEFQAAEMMIGLYREFPQSEWSPLALFNAAAIYERARQINTAIETYNLFLTAYPEHENVPEAVFTLGLIYDSQAQFETAADWFQRVDNYADFEERPDAIFNAARLREALSQFDEAIALYDHYMELDNENPIIPQLMFLIADIEQERGNLDAAYQRFETLRQRFAGSPSVRLAATVRQGRIKSAQDQTSQALQLYESAYEQFGAGSLVLDETGLPVEWSRQPGWQIEDPDQRVGSLPYAAEARFRTAEVAFEACQAISLDYPEGRWRILSRNLQSRGEALERAQGAMFEVMYMGDAAWSVAAATRIGELYKKFYDDMYQLPQPDLDECVDAGYAYEDCEALDDAYNTMLYEMMYPIETKARESFNQALAVSYDNDVYTEWTSRAATLLAQTDNTIRVTGEVGVEPHNRGQLYTGVEYLVDLSERIEQMQPTPALQASGESETVDAGPTGQTPAGQPQEGDTSQPETESENLQDLPLEE